MHKVLYIIGCLILLFLMFSNILNIVLSTRSIIFLAIFGAVFIISGIIIKDRDKISISNKKCGELKNAKNK